LYEKGNDRQHRVERNPADYSTDFRRSVLYLPLPLFGIQKDLV